jgi:hypothetical protein
VLGDAGITYIKLYEIKRYEKMKNLIESIFDEKDQMNNIDIKIIVVYNESKITLLVVTRKIDVIAIRAGSLPLQGIILFVTIAVARSFSDSIILHPVTPQALHPNPIAIVRACFPFVSDFWNILSILKAILGNSPPSSISEKRGKNIDIGGSITETIQVTVVYIPSNRKFLSVLFIPYSVEYDTNFDLITVKKEYSHSLI